MRPKKWTQESLCAAVKSSRSYRQVLIKLGLKPAGGNYKQIQKWIKNLGIDSKHFTGMGWNVGLAFDPHNTIPIKDILVENSSYQSHKLKIRLFKEGYKSQKCEICNWAQQSSDGRIPLELNHINGNHADNRIENLQILCPNCHSLQPTHRGRNKVKYRRAEMVEWYTLRS